MNANPVTGSPVAYRDLPYEDVRAMLPRVLPPNWREERAAGFDGVYSSPSLRVIFSAGVEEDGKRWAHVSVSRADKTLPSWLDLVEVRDVFLGREQLAVQVLPPRSEHYNIRTGIEVMHLWAPLDGSPLPNFLRARGGTL